LRIQSLDESIANYYKLDDIRGVIVTQVLPKSTASRSGLNVGDIILQVDEYKINNEQTLIGVFQEFRTGQTISIKIIRDNEQLIKKMTLERK
jgi:S1-C subfamily serine protease